MIGRTVKMVESKLLLVCLLVAAEGATNAGMRAPFRISSTPSLHPSSGSPGIAEGRETVGHILTEHLALSAYSWARPKFAPPEISP